MMNLESQADILFVARSRRTRTEHLYAYYLRDLRAKLKQVYSVEEGSQILDCCYRNGKMLLLDSKLNLHKFYTDRECNAIVEDITSLSQLEGMYQYIHDGLLLKDLRITSRAITSCQSFTLLETGQ